MTTRMTAMGHRKRRGARNTMEEALKLTPVGYFSDEEPETKPCDRNFSFEAEDCDNEEKE